MYLKTDLPDTSPSLLLDQAKIEQVLFNVIANAIKYTDNGGVFVQLQDHQLEVQIRIVDTGIGIEPEQEKQIYSAFSQTNEEDNSRGGAGIGLTISKAIIELHKGRIEFAPGANGGSIFSISLPKGKNLV